MRPPLAIVGTGAVARALGSALHRAGEPVYAVAGRDPDRAVAAARAIGGARACRVADIPGQSTHVLIATSDTHLPDVASELAAAGLASGVTLHTCGARGPEALAPLIDAGVSCGTFHPLQTIPGDAANMSFAGVSFAITGAPAAVDWGVSLCAALQGSAIHPRVDRMSAYHAAAVLAGNGVVALLDASLALMAHAGVDRESARSALAPLMRAALENGLRLGPERAATGPVVRGDAITVQSHVRALNHNPELPLDLYRVIGLQLVDLARRRGLPDERLQALASALEVTSRHGKHHA